MLLPDFSSVKLVSLLTLGLFLHQQILNLDDEEAEEDGAATDLDAQRTEKCVVIKTSTRQVCLWLAGCLLVGGWGLVNWLVGGSVWLDWFVSVGWLVGCRLARRFVFSMVDVLCAGVCRPSSYQSSV